MKLSEYNALKKDKIRKYKFKWRPNNANRNDVIIITDANYNTPPRHGERILKGGGDFEVACYWNSFNWVAI